MYIDKLDVIVNEYNNTYHITLKMKPADVKNNTCIDSGRNSKYKNPKVKVGDHVRVSKHKNIFDKGYTPNWSAVFMITKVESNAPWTYIISDLNVKKLLGRFTKNNCKKQIKKNLG